MRPLNACRWSGSKLASIALPLFAVAMVRLCLQLAGYSPRETRKIRWKRSRNEKAPPSPAGSVSARMRRTEKGRATMSETNEWNTAPKDGSEINVQFLGGTRARARWNAAKNGGEWEVLWQSGEWVSLKYDRGRGDPDIWWPR